MMNGFRTIALCLGTMVALFGGCSKNDPVERAQPAGAATPSVAEVKANAEEGFIYGLPIVENYAVQYAYVIDRNSGQWKAPYNEISNSFGSSPTKIR
jgi:hypothetical protein